MGHLDSFPASGGDVEASIWLVHYALEINKLGNIQFLLLICSYKYRPLITNSKLELFWTAEDFVLQSQINIVS